MILGGDGKRLSKRHGAVSVLQYRDDGFLPEALLNYLVRLGWSHGDQEVFSRQEMAELFELTTLQRAPAAFNLDKLLWLNQHYLKTLDPEYIVGHLLWHLEKAGIDVAEGPNPVELLIAQRDRCKTLVEIAEKSRFFYEEFEQYDATAASKNLTAEAAPALSALATALNNLADWDKEAIHQAIQKIAEDLQIGLGKVAQPLRVAVTGNTISPPIDITLALLGKQKTLARLQRALGICK
jgi:glutamyl-tRNA synthetase